jgi:hypothetical protein
MFVWSFMINDVPYEHRRNGVDDIFLLMMAEFETDNIGILRRFEQFRQIFLGFLYTCEP